MKPEPFSIDMKIASFTADEFVKLRIALNNHEVSLQRLLTIDSSLEPLYKTELNQLKEAKEVLSAAMRRDP
jgi:hypothetical protein